MINATAAAIVEGFQLAKTIAEFLVAKGWEQGQANHLAAIIFNGFVDSMGGDRVYIPTRKSVERHFTKEAVITDVDGRPLTAARVAALSKRYHISRRQVFYLCQSNSV